jgi:hypothetical protein
MSEYKSLEDQYEKPEKPPKFSLTVWQSVDDLRRRYREAVANKGTADALLATIAELREVTAQFDAERRANGDRMNEHPPAPAGAELRYRLRTMLEYVLYKPLLKLLPEDARALLGPSFIALADEVETLARFPRDLGELVRKGVQSETRKRVKREVRKALRVAHLDRHLHARQVETDVEWIKEKILPLMSEREREEFEYQLKRKRATYSELVESDFTREWGIPDAYVKQFDRATLDTESDPVKLIDFDLLDLCESDEERRIAELLLADKSENSIMRELQVARRKIKRVRNELIERGQTLLQEIGYEQIV